MSEKKAITICMGSSCFSRGNNQNLKLIKEYIKGREAEVFLSGALCREQCSKGPVIYFGDKMLSCVESADLPNLLDAYLNGDES